MSYQSERVATDTQLYLLGELARAHASTGQYDTTEILAGFTLANGFVALTHVDAPRHPDPAEAIQTTLKMQGSSGGTLLEITLLPYQNRVEFNMPEGATGKREQAERLLHQFTLTQRKSAPYVAGALGLCTQMLDDTAPSTYIPEVVNVLNPFILDNAERVSRSMVHTAPEEGEVRVSTSFEHTDLPLEGIVTENTSCTVACPNKGWMTDLTISSEPGSLGYSSVRVNTATETITEFPYIAQPDATQAICFLYRANQPSRIN
jgi:hypothetical protein